MLVWYQCLSRKIIQCLLGGSPFPDINPREIPGMLQTGYRMPKPRHIDEKLQASLSRFEKMTLNFETFFRNLS